ncbi:MAG: outer membrane protein assembly factor BamD [Gemmatimonadetes bacterium]|nr:outer membrane protein assembly factor BamD [Gemmatimonadota bacterium]
MSTSRVALALLILAPLGGCWPFKGKPKPVVAPALENSPRTIDSLWQAGQGAFNRGRWGEANRIFTRLSTAMPVTDPRLTRMHFYRGEIELALGNELDAVRLFRRVSDETPDDSLAADALQRAGEAYSYLWRRPELDPTYGQTALGVFQEVQARYPGTAAASRAAARIEDLNNRFAFKQYRNALFYYKFKAYDSAILSLRALVAEYPRAEIVPTALETLVQSYQALGYEEDIKETCGYIARFFPAPTGPKRLCPPAADSASAS